MAIGATPAAVQSYIQQLKAANTTDASYWAPRTTGTKQNPGNQDKTPEDQAKLPGGSGSGGGSSANAADLAFLDSQENSLRQQLARAQTTLGQGITGLQDAFNRETSKANQQRSRALEDFGLQRDDTIRAKGDALGRVDTNARVLNDSLRKRIGMASGSGSSAYQYAAPNAVAREASGERTDVLGDYAVNERNLGLAERRAEQDFASLLEEIGRNRQSKEQQLRQSIAETEQDINSRLGGVAGQRAALRGGGYGAIRAAQSPYEAAIAERQSTLDNLFNQFRNPVLSTRQVEVQKPELRDYMVDRAAINANEASGGARDAYSPYSNFLRRDEEELGYI